MHKLPISITARVGEKGVSSLSQTSRPNVFPAARPAASERVSDSTEKKPDPREAQRLRRLEIFQEWDKGGTFAEIGRKFGLTRIRTRQIVLKAVMGDGCRSERARAWTAQIDETGFWLSRYDARFHLAGDEEEPLASSPRETSSLPETHISKGDGNVN